MKNDSRTHTPRLLVFNTCKGILHCPSSWMESHDLLTPICSSNSRDARDVRWILSFHVWADCAQWFGEWSLTVSVCISCIFKAHEREHCTTSDHQRVASKETYIVQPVVTDLMQLFNGITGKISDIDGSCCNHSSTAECFSLVSFIKVQIGF